MSILQGPALVWFSLITSLHLHQGAVQSIINQTPGGPVGTAASSALNNINQAQIALNAIQRASNACRNPQQLEYAPSLPACSKPLIPNP